jgi:hypothetical protein
MARTRIVRTADGGTATVVRHGKYNVRDQLGHWVEPVSKEDKPCPHACCRGKRVHPKNLPVKIDRGYLRSLTDEELETELGQYQRYSDTHERGFLQIVAEFGRRDVATAAKERARDRGRRKSEEHRDEVYRQWLQAESATSGVMLNRAGIHAGINERSLFTGPAKRVQKYASPELREFFEQRGRPLRSSFLGSGKNTFDVYQ